METKYNMKSPAVKRLMREAQELHESTEEFYAQPLEDNLFEWHFTVRGAPETDFDGGLYHGRIILPPDYPMKPPSIILLTPNGRFETNKKICLSISGYHPESWQPSWSIRTALLAIIGFMPTPGNGAIGSLDYTPQERKVMARKSIDWSCKECGAIKRILPNAQKKTRPQNEEACKLAAQISFKGEAEPAMAESTTANRVTAVTGTTAASMPPSSPGMAGIPFSQLLSNPVSIALPNDGDPAPATVPHIPINVSVRRSNNNIDQPSASGSSSNLSSTNPQESATGGSIRHRFDLNTMNSSVNSDTAVASASAAGNAVSGAGESASVTKPPVARQSSAHTSLLVILLLSLAIFGLLFRRLFYL